MQYREIGARSSHLFNVSLTSRLLSEQSTCVSECCPAWLVGVRCGLILKKIWSTNIFLSIYVSYLNIPSMFMNIFYFVIFLH